MKFIGRSEYLDKLSALWEKKRSSFAVVSGRRRIGKSTLVEEFARRSACDFIEIVGLPPDRTMTNQRQIDNFCERLARAAKKPEAKADCWPKAFDALHEAIHPRRKTIVFLDEISWMGRYDGAFAGFLKTAWDTQLSLHDNLILVVAGSVSAWIQANVQRSKAYVGRISLDITLPELSLSECRAFWGRKADRTATREILDVLSVTGGVPKYLAEVNPSLSADENIRRLCFDPDGYDVGDLIEAGFVAGARGKNPGTGRDVREVRYRLKDNYTRFYLKYILPKADAIKEGIFRYVSLERLPNWNSIMGLQFENLVLNNFHTLARRIGLVGKSVESVAPYFRRGRKAGDGVQIDMLVQLPKSVYLVEVKRMNTIPVAVEQEVQRKIDRLPLKKGMSVRTVLVYDGELAPELEEDGFFDHLVGMDELLRQS